MAEPEGVPPNDPISLDVGREVVRLSELYLDGTIKLALAADARAMQTAALCSAAASALVIAGLGYVSEPSRLNTALGTAAFSAAAAFYVALFLALRAASPRDFNIAGNLRSSWAKEELRRPLIEALLSQAANYDVAGLENTAILTLNAGRIENALRSAFVAPAAALTGGCAAFFYDEIKTFVVG